MLKIKSAEILCVGTEILIGDIVNTNAAYISGRLAALGITQYYQGVVGDNPKRLSARLTEALERCDLVIMTGGLGPTYDDLTKETAAAVMGRRLVPHTPSMERIKAYFERSRGVMSAANEKQAWMPEGCIVFDNSHGTAPGCVIEDDERGKAVMMLPGPPREMKPMWDESGEPYLAKFSDHVLVSRNVNICGIGESAVETILSDLMRSSENPTVAPYSKDGEVRLRVTAAADSAAAGLPLCDAMIARVRGTEVGKWIYGIDTSLEEALVRLLKERGLHITAAESCTGGLISQRITSVPGASEVYDGGVITYANRIKETLVSVPAETLAAHGAVSEETACAMAEGVRLLMGADIGISATGIAGPGGGTPEKPVGTVYIGISTPDGTEAKRFSFTGDRERIRLLTSSHALRMVLVRLMHSDE